MLLSCFLLSGSVKLSHVLTRDNFPEFVMKGHNCFAFFPLNYWIELSIYVRLYCASFKASVGKYRIQEKKTNQQVCRQRTLHLFKVDYKVFTLPSRRDSEDENS